MKISQRLRDYVSLTKPRIVFLLMITCFCAMVVAQGGLPPLDLTLLTLLGLYLSAGGAHAINMWYDRDIDGVMERTKNRPIPAGRIPAHHSLILGIVLIVAAFVLLTLTVNLLSALFALAGFLYYVFIYTFWLKRRSPQNIVIGGGAGSFPPLVGWAAVTGSVALAPLLMFLIIFFWTPPHFWALALYKQEDYRRANIPMMPVTRGDEVTKVQSLVYTVLLLLVSVALYLTGVVGEIYLVVAVIINIIFIVHSILLMREMSPAVVWAKKTFHFSNLYLAILFFVMVLDVK